MKKVYLLISSLFISSAVLAQELKNVGIGTTAPDQSAALDIQSFDKGLLIPRLTEQQMNAVSTPAKGLLVFKTDSSNPGFFFYSGEKWSPLSNGDANAIATVDANGWALDGNATTTVNKAAATASSFIGTPAGVPINFKIGTDISGTISSSKELVALGYKAAEALGGVQNVAIGHEALKVNTTNGNYNVAIGSRALIANTVGVGNAAIGARGLTKNIDGFANMSIGYLTLFNNEHGHYNTAIGSQALFSSVGNRNVAIGNDAGFSTTGNSSIFIGYQAGYSEVGSNKLYIANSNTVTPLVYGDFSAKFVSIGDVPVAKRDAVASSGAYSLIVEKGILSEKLKVALKSTTDWADYVFEQDYKDNMMSLEEVEAFTLENKHLPNVPSATDLVEKGLDFNETSQMFMEKIEELTLYMIELNKQVKSLKAENADLKEMIKK